MCDVTAVLINNGSEEKILENVDVVEETSSGVKLVNIFGEERSLKARMVRFDNSAKKMTFAPA